ncbi:MAG: 16S rRNA (cytosine(1402)-N(4))-methyltransferase RsmH [Ferrovum myxofaciens]|uniref:16S rRNA (cytosine(1402)-N(4))-methyltransferase RsmH n=1 Tax=Ferrovum myxofaciens TaxID=416213 RepID=UPI002356BAB2|nr:16S rRNA (cytosine(1402)-N(4))-methyltransferase RsmH [Ferrovum myxofaciens]QKE41060.1 MAG: 16S rRNA (cytosine(1402)-N(4))-methyltransferase RsmH [Ferrovum myxofaciens]
MAQSFHSDIHHSVLLQEAVQALDLRPEGIYVDGTFGRGGHSQRILQEMAPTGQIVALDRDPAAIAAGRQALQDPRMILRQARFSQLEEVLLSLGITGVDGILLDLGVSSPQLDQAERGFSFRQEGPLDMRMDPGEGMTAATWLNQVDEKELAEVIHKLGEERFARQVARAIIQARAQRPLETTRQLAQIVATAVRTREVGQDPATRTFQAIRLHINRELDELAAVLPQALRVLKSGGRLVIISFHSLEDRLVKHYFQAHSRPPEIPRGMAVRESDRPPPLLRLVGRAQRAGRAEVVRNPRSRSAILRVAERTGA